MLRRTNGVAGTSSRGMSWQLSLLIGAVALVLNDVALGLILRRSDPAHASREAEPVVKEVTAEAPVKVAAPGFGEIERRLAALEERAAVVPAEAERAEPAPAVDLRKMNEHLDGLAKAKPATAVRHVNGLVELGEATIPRVSEALAHEMLASYGGGAVIANTTFMAYPSERIALLDVLRLIDTDEARKALLAAIRTMQDPGDLGYLDTITRDYGTGTIADAVKDAYLRGLGNGKEDLRERWSLACRVLRDVGRSPFAGDSTRGGQAAVVIRSLYEQILQHPEIQAFSQDEFDKCIATLIAAGR